ncbi:MAG TPA: GGDEF domain-containing protein [Pirellulales bacterium]|jgi:diguanylate cyclase|nr:GGDEF domain-containing protein [Pirellulales bacterium]
MDMTILLTFGLVFAAAELALGTMIGWWIRGKRDITQVAAQSQAADEQTTRARKALDNLNRLAASVAANVGEHNTQVQAISSELTVTPDRGKPDESLVLANVAKLLEANERLQAELRSAENKLNEQAHELEARSADALTDALTGRANRRAFDNEIERRILEWNRKQTPVTLFMIDVDHFKKFNDTHGHQAGDEVLRGVGQSLFKSMRDMDLVARYGGEEFAVVMPATIMDQAKPAVERARVAVEKALFDFEGKQLQVTISGGIAQSQLGDAPANLLKRADEALYAAKKAGRNRSFLHTGEQALPLVLDARPSLNQAAGAKENPRAVLPGKQPADPSKPSATIPTATLPTAKTSPKADAAAEKEKTDKASAGETDPQTGVASRAVFNLDMRRRVAESKRYSSPLSSMLVTIDQFAKFVEINGEAMANLVLRTVAQFLSAAVREMDTVARFGEDSFAILLPGTKLTGAAAIAERLRQSISLHALKSATGDLQLTVSVGVVEVEEGDEPETLSQRTVAATALAIRLGCNRTCINRAGESLELDALAAN